MTIVEMLEKNARELPDKIAIIFQDTKITWKEFDAHANALASFLMNAGLKKGGRVGLMLEKSPEAVLSFLGAAKVGGIVFPIDFNLTRPAIQSILDITRPSAVIVSEKFQALLADLDIADTTIVIVGQKENNVYRTWHEIVSMPPVGAPDVEIQEDDVVYLNYTSGTTGIPKGAVTTHANIYWNTLSSIECLHLTPDDVHLCMFPIFAHTHELFARPLYLGGTLVLVDNISPKTITKAILDHKVTCMMAVASIYLSLIRFNESHSMRFNSLSLAESGGMHFNSTLAQEFKNYFNIPIVPVWGSTETTGIALSNPISGPLKPGSMGKPCPYYEVKIVDDDGNELPPNKTGELAIRGPAVCLEYYRNPEETRKYLKDGWFLSGDLATRDSDGCYFFISRRTGMMKVAGMKVSPIEVEEVLYQHPGIAEAAVVKTHDPSHGEVPKAVIVPKNNIELTKQDIRKYCEDRMAKYKVPRVIEFATELPKTPGGKILYRKL